MALLKARVTIEGKSPILFHSFSIDSIPLGKKEKTGVAGNDPEEWKASVLMTKERQLFVNAAYIFGCLRDGGRQIRSGRGTIQAKIASTLVVLDEIILLDRFVPSENKLSRDKSEPVYLDIRSVKNPATRARNIRYRIAASPGWTASFQIEWENTIVSRNEMHSAMESAGSYAGLGDGRNIGCGRFVVTQFEVEETKEPKSKKKR